MQPPSAAQSAGGKREVPGERMVSERPSWMVTSVSYSEYGRLGVDDDVVDGRRSPASAW
jgi:hypothetical protein